MKIMVYGAGVIGSYLTHVLCAAGHDVSLLARGKRKGELEKNGLVIYHHIQKKTTIDHPHIIEKLIPETAYDAVFAVMQYQQMRSILDDLSVCKSPLVALVGNNPSASEMEQYIKDHSPTPKTVLFGFQATGGRRENGMAICVRLGAAGLQCGFLHSEPDGVTKAKLKAIFGKTRYKITYTNDMDAWYKCHLALVLPVGYVCYANDCDLKKASHAQLRQMMDAVREGYGVLKALEYPILPEGDEMYFERGPKRAFTYALFWAMAKTAIGRLAASDHCRSAVTEMQSLNDSFDQLKKQAKLSTPVWDSLEQYLPCRQENQK